MRCGSNESSEDQKVGQRFARTQAANGPGQKRRHRNCIHLGAGGRGAESEGQDRVGDDDAIDGGIFECGFGARHEHAVRHQR